MRELLERLCALNAVSSWEDEVRAFLLAEVEPHADRLRVDALGNLIAWKKGRKHTGSKLLLTAHMDEVGLMIRQITDDGYLKFDTVGAIDRRVLLGKPVLVGPKRVPGVVGLKAYHLVSREEEKSVPKLDEFYIDIGARDRAGAEAQVALGDTAAFDSDAGDFGAGLFQGKALGSRLGCAVLLTLLRDELPMDCTFVFTAQKEVGARGAFGAAFSVTPEVALVVDGADAADLAGVPGGGRRHPLADHALGGRTHRYGRHPADQRGGTDGGGVHPRALPPHPVRRDLPAGRGGGPGPDPGLCWTFGRKGVNRHGTD